MKFVMAPAMILFALVPVSWANGLSCESGAAVVDASTKLAEKLDSATFEESKTLWEQGYGDLLRLDPQDYRASKQYLSQLRYSDPGKWESLFEKVMADAKEYPTDPVVVTIVATTLVGRDTPRAFELLEQLTTAQPNYAPSYRELAGMY